MKVWLLVPVKSFDQAKSRLAVALAPAERALLSRRLLARTLEVAQASGLFAGTLVVSHDLAVLEFARSGARPRFANGAAASTQRWTRAAGRPKAPAPRRSSWCRPICRW